MLQTSEEPQREFKGKHVGPSDPPTSDAVSSDFGTELRNSWKETQGLITFYFQFFNYLAFVLELWTELLYDKPKLVFGFIVYQQMPK